MKLVNVDEISDTTIPMMYLDYNRNDWVQCKIVTKDAPEVKAVSVEWIKKYAHRCIELQDTNYYSFRDLGEIGNGILAMLEEWEKENE